MLDFSTLSILTSRRGKKGHMISLIA